MKKVIYIILLVVTIWLASAIAVSATETVKVTADSLNIRKSASTSAKILTQISKGDTCELIEEEGDWYKIKYKTYTGYVSKEYVEVQQSTNNNESSNSKEQENVIEYIETTGKTSEKTDVRILPLINSSVIESLNKNEEITIISELNGWAYIQTDSFDGWIRSDTIKNKKSKTVKVANNTNNEEEKNNSDTKINTSKETSNINNSEEETKNNENVISNTVETNKNEEKNTTETNKNEETNTNKTVYVKETYVNLRKKANTSSDILMVVAKNTKLTVVGEDGEWYKLKTSEGDAYVLKTLVSDTKITTSRGDGIRTATTVTTETTEEVEDNAKISKTENSSSNKSTSATTSSQKTSTKGEEIVKYAKQFLGVPYVYGGASSKGFDCSGFTMYVYKKFGISMGHGAQMQSKLGKKVNADKTSSSSLKNNLQPGDLVFFLDYETMDEIGHCGIYIGDGNFIHASSGSGYCVKINSLLPGEYYNTRYCAARRVI